MFFTAKPQAHWDQNHGFGNILSPQLLLNMNLTENECLDADPEKLLMDVAGSLMEQGDWKDAIIISGNFIYSMGKQPNRVWGVGAKNRGKWGMGVKFKSGKVRFPFLSGKSSLPKKCFFFTYLLSFVTMYCFILKIN